METGIGSGWLEGCEVEADHDAREIHCDIVLGSSGHNVIVKPKVFEVGPAGKKTNVSEAIAEIKYFLEGAEYDTLAVGEAGEFYCSDLRHRGRHSGKPLTLIVRMTDETVIVYSLTFDIIIVEP